MGSGCVARCGVGADFSERNEEVPLKGMECERGGGILTQPVPTCSACPLACALWPYAVGSNRVRFIRRLQAAVHEIASMCVEYDREPDGWRLTLR